MATATWVHGGSPLFTDISTSPAGVSANGDLAAAAATWDATGDENGDTGTVAVTSEVSPGSIATVQVGAQVFDDGSFNPSDALNSLRLVFDWQLTNGPMGTATAGSSFNSICDATDDPHGPGTSSGTYDRTITGVDLGVATIGDFFTFFGIGGVVSISVNCVFNYASGTFSNHNRRLAISNFQVIVDYGATSLAISPSSGYTSGNESVSITGGAGNWDGTTRVFFGKYFGQFVEATNVSASGSSLTCDTPPFPIAELVGFYVTTTGFPDEGLLESFTYVDPSTSGGPGSFSVTPDHGPVTGGTPVTLTGNDIIFSASPRVFFRASGESPGSEATSVSGGGTGTLTCTTSAHILGDVDVIVYDS